MDNHAHKEDLPKGNQEELGELQNTTQKKPLLFARIGLTILYIPMAILFLCGPFLERKQEDTIYLNYICPVVGVFFVYSWLVAMGWIKEETQIKHGNKLQTFLGTIFKIIGILLCIGVACWGIYSLFGFLASASITTILLIVIIIILLLK